jgi:hypothetical protein
MDAKQNSTPSGMPSVGWALFEICGKPRSRSLPLFVTEAMETRARYGTIRTFQWGYLGFENRCLNWGKDKTAGETGRTIPLVGEPWLPSAFVQLISGAQA